MIKIAITKGRIEKQVCQLLAKKGFDMDPIFHKDRELLIETKDGIQMIFAKSNDVLTFLEHGIVDVGFVGSDTLMESDYDDYYEMLDLEIGKCYFALCAYPEYKEKHFERVPIQNIKKSILNAVRKLPQSILRSPNNTLRTKEKMSKSLS